MLLVISSHCKVFSYKEVENPSVVPGKGERKHEETFSGRQNGKQLRKGNVPVEVLYDGTYSPFVPLWFPCRAVNDTLVNDKLFRFCQDYGCRILFICLFRVSLTLHSREEIRLIRESLQKKCFLFMCRSRSENLQCEGGWLRGILFWKLEEGAWWIRILS